MKVIRQGLFETNSSSEHSLSIMKETVYEAWKNDRVAVMFKFDEDDNSDRGGDSDGYLSTWGNFSAFSLKVSTCPIQKKLEENMKILGNWVKEKEKEENGWWISNFKALIDEYEKTEVFTDEMYKIFPYLYYSREEYKEMLLRDDCESPFFYRGEGVVVIGHYFHS